MYETAKTCLDIRDSVIKDSKEKNNNNDDEDNEDDDDDKRQNPFVGRWLPDFGLTWLGCLESFLLSRQPSYCQPGGLLIF